MYEWMQSRQQFTVQELEQQFNEKWDRSLFNNVFSRLEDEQLIGNMGDLYEWIAWRMAAWDWVIAYNSHNYLTYCINMELAGMHI